MIARLLLCLAMLLTAPFMITPAQAQLSGTDTAAGDPCDPSEEGYIRRNASATRDTSEITLICDGSVWQKAYGGSTGDCTFSQSDNFDSGFGNWSNTTGDDHDWTLNSGDTGSSGVGPSDDAGGGGQYAYTEASSPVAASEEFILESNTIDEDCTLEVTFKWNKRGDNMGDLLLESTTGSGWIMAWSHSGSDVDNDGTDVWNTATVNVGMDVTQVRFRAIMPDSGDIWNSDIAVDDVTIAEAPSVSDLSGLTCATGQIAMSTGSGWVCTDMPEGGGGSGGGGDSDCSSQTVAWGNCSDSVSAAAHGDTANVSQSSGGQCSAGWEGSATFECVNGVWSQTGGSCTYDNGDHWSCGGG